MMWFTLALAAEPVQERPEAELIADVTVDLAEEAELLFRRGIEAYRARRYTDALQHLLASNRIVPNRVVVFDLARTYEELGRLEQAWRYYSWYTAMEGDPTKRAEGERALERLTPKVARVSIATAPPGAAVYLDDRALGRRGFTPMVLALPPGTHHLVLEREGSPLSELDTELTLGELTEVEIALPKAAAVPAPQTAKAVVWGTGQPLAEIGSARCEVLGTTATFEPSPESLAFSGGSALALQQEPTGLVLDLTIDAHSLRTSLAPGSKRGLDLVDPAPLHAAVFARCTPTDEAGIGSALSAMAKPERLDAVRLVAEWAAWRGAVEVPAAAARCVDKGKCEALAQLLTEDR